MWAAHFSVCFFSSGHKQIKSKWPTGIIRYFFHFIFKISATFVEIKILRSQEKRMKQESEFFGLNEL